MAIGRTESFNNADRPHQATALVRKCAATQDFHDVNAAIAAGYGSAGSCVTGPEKGAMGMHYPNGTGRRDGVLDEQRPEFLIHEQKGGRLSLLGVDYIVIVRRGTPTPPHHQC